MLHLIQMWLDAPVEETESGRQKKRTTRNRRRETRCSPGVTPITIPVNMYMRRFVLGWKRLEARERYKAKIVNYADD